MRKKLKLAFCLSAFLSSYAQAVELKLISTPLASRYADLLSQGQKISIVQNPFKDFCHGIGAHEVDILFSDKRISPEDIQNCQQKGISKIVELPLAYNAILLQTSSEAVNFNLSVTDLYKAFSAYRWDVNKGIVGNDAQSWNDIDKNLSEIPINIIQKIWPQEELETLFNEYIFQACSPPSSDELERNFKAYEHWKEATQFFAFSDLLFLEQAFERYKRGTVFAQENYCKHFRADRYYIMNDEAFNKAKVSAYPKENQIFVGTYASQDPNFFILRINNQIPSADTIEQGLYPLSYGIYMYIKLAHVGAKKNLKEYIETQLLFSVENLIDTAQKNKYILPKVSHVRESLEAYKGYQHHIQPLSN